MARPLLSFWLAEVVDLTLFERKARLRLLERREQLVEQLASKALLVRAAVAGGDGLETALHACQRGTLELASVDRAMVRITLGTYGSCEACGHGLGAQRLGADPEARLCMSCGEEKR